MGAGRETQGQPPGAPRALDAPGVLRRSAYFRDFSEASRERIAAICLPKRLRKREILFVEGEKGVAFYCLADGSVQLSKVTEEGQEVVIKTVRPGEVFGEVVLFEQDRYPVTACTLRPSFCYTIPRHPFTCLLRDEAFLRDFIAVLMRKQRYLADRIRDLTAHDLEDRLRIFLHEQFGPQARVEPGLSKRDVAAAVGATPEALSRLLARLRREGRLRWEGGTIQAREDFWGRDDEA